MSGSGQARKKGGGPPTNSIDIVVVEGIDSLA